MLRQRQSLPLDCKIEMTKQKIRHWYNYWEGKVYISFSGGKDSTVLLHLVRSMYPNIPGVFVDTGLEFPEIRRFVKTFDNITWLKPKMTFRKVLEKYGFPVVSKENSQKLHEIRTTKSEKLRNKRLYGGDNRKYKTGKLPDKWKYLINAPFKISHQCCNIMKKNPTKKYSKDTGNMALLGTMASDSRLRWQKYLKLGCNSFSGKIESCPLSFWKEDDIWEYITTKNLDYADIYNKGYNRTGCVFCCFGVHRDKINKFQIMKKTHPKLYNYCINFLGVGKIFNFMKINY